MGFSSFCDDGDEPSASVITGNLYKKLWTGEERSLIMDLSLVPFYVYEVVT